MSKRKRSVWQNILLALVGGGLAGGFTYKYISTETTIVGAQQSTKQDINIKAESSKIDVNAPNITQDNRGATSLETVGRDKISTTNIYYLFPPKGAFPPDSNKPGTSYGNGAIVNNGTNNGIMGNNNTVNITHPQPHPDAGHVTEMQKMYPDKSTKLRFMYAANSRPSQIFVDELIQKLKDAGYKDVSYIIDLASQIKAPRGIIKMDKPQEPASIQFFVNVEE